VISNLSVIYLLFLTRVSVNSINNVLLLLLYNLDNSEDILSYDSNHSAEGSYADVRDGLCYQSERNHQKNISIVWHIDGAPTIKSKTLEIWLITAFIVELPVAHRFALKNILFCGIWYGAKKPDFQLFQIHFVKDVKHLRDQGMHVLCNNDLVHFHLRVEASLADLPARAASLNMKQFNGKFGCPVCYHPGVRLREGSMVRIYPFQERAVRLPDRTHAETCHYAERAIEEGEPFFGVKGNSVVLEIVSVPTKIPFDYMHLILEGEFKRKLSRYFFPPRGFICKVDLATLNLLLKEVKFPHDFSKKVSEFSEQSVRRAKAGELQLLLLHLLLPILKSIIPNDVYCHFGLLVTAIQLLNKDVATDNDINTADQMLNLYHKIDASLYDDQSQTFTNHALIHLSEQRRTHGCPVILLSNFVFEGFIASLIRQYHGTRNIVSQMVNNIALLQNIGSITGKVDDDGFKLLADNIAFGSRNRRKLKISDELYLCGEISHSSPILPGTPRFDQNDQASYCERIWYKGNIYHSIAYRYKRNSNSYTVSFLHENQKIFGSVLYFVKNGERCTMVVKCLSETDERLFDEDMIGCLHQDVDEYCLSRQRMEGGIYLIYLRVINTINLLSFIIR